MSKNTSVQAAVYVPKTPADNFDWKTDRSDIKLASKSHKILSNEPYAAALYAMLIGSASGQNTDIKVGSIVEGVLASFNETDALLDIGYKDYVRVPQNVLEQPYFQDLVIGNKISVLITEIIEKPYSIIGSISAGVKEQVNKILAELYNKEDELFVTVEALSNSGYICSAELDGLKTSVFMPNMQAGVNRILSPEALIGQSFNVLVHDFYNDKNLYAVSRKKLLERSIPSQIKELKYDQTYTGVVTGTTAFGVFVEFNECLTGMIHKANLHPDYVEHIMEIPAGTEIDFYVKEVVKGSKIILTQFLRESLWDTLKISNKLDGIVRDVKAFGALIQLDDETAGLIHISELSKSESLEKGDKIKVKVIAINRNDRKIFLSEV